MKLIDGKKRNTEEDFWGKVLIPDDSNGCWLWLGYTLSHGYGTMRYGGKNRRAHRLAYEFTYGQIKQAALVLHLCAVKNCVNPLHLYLGTPHDNAQDSINDGTMARGISHGLTKLKNNEVREIRLLASGGLSQRQIAKKFGVSKSSICKIVHYENWGHI